MKLDVTVMRTMSKEDYRVLGAVEIGMKTHELVPVSLCMSIARLRHGGANKVMSSLLRDKLLSHDRSKGYDGYRLTNSGYDILALRTLFQKKIVSALGDKIGIGKESDIYIAATPEGKQVVLKFHRLGRTSFRAVRKKRDYLRGNGSGKSTSWLFMSRLSALKEYAFMKALHSVGYPTPTPLSHSRHVVAMTLVRGCPLYQVRTRSEVSPLQAESIFNQSVDLAARLARHGLVHCDLNEFNLMVDLSGIQQTLNSDNDVGGHYVRNSGATTRGEGALSVHSVLGEHQSVDGTGEKIIEEKPKPMETLEDGTPKPLVTLIDFPQMVSTKHPNAKELYERDVECLIKFFIRKLNVVGGEGEESMREGWTWEDVNAGGGEVENVEGRLDGELQASGFSDENVKRDLELYYFNKREAIAEVEEGEEGESDEEDEEGESEEEGEGEQEEEEEEEEEVSSEVVSEVVSEEASASHLQNAQQLAKQKVKQQLGGGRKQGGKLWGNSSKRLVKGKKMHKEKINTNDGW
ncbi:hypothetical protein TrLO_g10246 [Triparma laevis f. longispina]|uniref:Serine/threonine-protein kinase RIO2 n=1 Tax=Triparma laevis f. longispina TaxID=1714387 RepID=A0A9W7DSS1_9STRA|nr:hypothetical protein TrLO_g10246 [Triparma laevis f. longispina]